MLQFISVVAVNEAGQGGGVAVDVGVKEQPAVCLLVELGESALLLMLVSVVVYHDLRRSYRRTTVIKGVRLFNARLPVVSVQISQLVVEPKIAVLDPVRVEHRHHLKDEDLAQHEAGLAVAEEKADEAFDEVGGRGLRWMHPGSQKDNWAVSQSSYFDAYLKGRSLAFGKISSLRQGSFSEKDSMLLGEVMVMSETFLRSYE